MLDIMIFCVLIRYSDPSSVVFREFGGPSVRFIIEGIYEGDWIHRIFRPTLGGVFGKPSSLLVYFCALLYIALT